MDDALTFGFELEQEQDYPFRVRFDRPEVDTLLLDEPPPLGGGQDPNAARLIGAAVANCLSSSLLVTESVRRGIPVGVRVLDGSGAEVFAGVEER